MKTQDPMKPVGTWEVRRRIKIPALVHVADALSVEKALSELSGVRKVAADVAQHCLAVRYDASETDYQTIVTTLEKTGFPPLNNWWSKFKVRWFQDLDTNARDNANAPTSSCCNKPPK